MPTEIITDNVHGCIQSTKQYIMFNITLPMLKRQLSAQRFKIRSSRTLFFNSITNVTILYSIIKTKRQIIIEIILYVARFENFLLLLCGVIVATYKHIGLYE